MRRVAAVLSLAAAGALAFAGCALFDGDPPSRACRTNNDCFSAQGEACNTTTHQCETRIDAAVPPIDAAEIDALEVDAATDADIDATIAVQVNP